MPKKLFIGFDSPVPPRSRRSRTVGELADECQLSKLDAYQTSVFWHHAMKAVAPQTSPMEAI